LTVPPTDSRMNARNGRVATWCVLLVVGMGAMSYAAVPLYRLFCQATGFAGTTQRASKPSDVMVDRIVNVRFDANVGPGLPWSFEPVQHTLDVRLGENALVFYRARNTADHPVTATASFNVYPDTVGAYFNKLQCFCFTEQTLQPGESIEMPVSFYVDPAMAEDKDGLLVRYITLSYTFHAVDKPRQSAAAPAAGTGPGGT